MKNFKIIFIVSLMLILFASPVIAEILQGEVDLSWPLLNQEERVKIIGEYRNLLFKNINYKTDPDKFSDHKKDKNWKQNIIDIKAGFLDHQDKKLAAFYLFNRILVIYGIKYEKDKIHIYYYDALGKLRYIDYIDKNYDEFPNIAYQYNDKGNLVGAIYNLSDYDSYVFNADGKFYGRWYNDKCYDKKAKIIMTRKLPD